MSLVRLHKTVGVKVGRVQVGGGAPIVVQSMTLTDTADARATAAQCVELAEAGSEMVRVTVNIPEAAAAVPEIKQRMLDAGCDAPLIGDFHYNGHLLLTKYPKCARALDKYRINPGNVGTGKRRDEQFSTICKVAVDNGRPVRIGVNGGSLNQELVVAKMQENTDRELGRTSEEIINECMVLSAIQSTELAIESGLRKDQIIISCKTSRPRDLIAVYRELARRTEQPRQPSSLTADRLQRELHLNPEQADKMRSVLTQMDNELSNLRSLDLRETDGIFSRAKDRMDPIVAPDQRPRLQAILDEHRRRFEETPPVPDRLQ